jgi:hypothetical protein
MTKTNKITPRFVDLMPTAFESRVLYISRKYKTAIHLCCCGCGNKVVTPLKPGQWSLTEQRDGSVSLSPSIGNWSLPCQSHYWIRHNNIDWAYAFTTDEIAAVRAGDKRALEQRYVREQPTLWERFTRWLRQLLRF